VTESTIHERLAELRHRTDLGERLHGQVVMDQVYAHYQHEHLEFRHPRGGGPLYLTRPLMEHYAGWLLSIARSWQDDGGKRAMQHAMEDLSDRAEIAAPWEFVDLARSGSPRVDVGQRTVYERPPKQHRLTERELKLKDRLRWRTLPDALKGWIYWHKTARGLAGLPPPRRHA
jgi:hypothetical protein